MPELGPKNFSLAKNIRRYKDRYPQVEEIEALVDKYDQEYVGHGGESVVVAVPGEEGTKKVVAFNYEDVTPEKAKKIFYSHRIFSTLFPHNFPHFYASSSGQLQFPNSKNISGTIRERITKSRLHTPKKVVKFLTGTVFTKYPFSEVKRVCRELGIKYSIDGSYSENFLIGVDGGEYYVDNILCWMVGQWDMELITQYMKENKYSPIDIKIVQLSVERLEKLSKPLPAQTI